MTVLSIVQHAAPKIGITRPTQLVADTGNTSLEMQRTLIDVAEEIRDFYDWQTFKTLMTITGDGSALAFSLPSDYARFLKNGHLWPSSSPITPLTHYTDSDAWLATIVQNFTPVVGGWTLLGGQLQIRMGGSSAPLALAAVVYAYYITKNVFASAGGVAQSTIIADTDTFRLPEHLLRLGFIARWKSNKGRPYAQDESDFQDSLAVAAGNDKGSKIMHVGRQRVRGDLVVAAPWPITGSGP
jgi:hypothetical protein